MSAKNNTIRVGTRKSELAMRQANCVVDELKMRFPDRQFEIVSKTTTGDERLDVALNKIGEKALFTKELEDALENDEVDLVVHSCKDLPTELPPGMVIGAIMERVDPKDAVVVKSDLSYKSLSDMKAGCRIGTSSVRRTAQIKLKYPDLELVDVRGNLNTRLRKLDADDGKYDALVLAAAGIIRMGWKHRITYLLDNTECLHAVGQGALAIEVKENDVSTQKIVQTLHDPETLLSIIAERAFMRKLEGGCSAPVAAHAQVAKKFGVKTLKMEGGVWSLDGTKSLREKGKVNVSDLSLANSEDEDVVNSYSSCIARNLPQADLKLAEKLGTDLANNLISRGATKILSEARNETAKKS